MKSSWAVIRFFPRVSPWQGLLLILTIWLFGDVYFWTTRTQYQERFGYENLAMDLAEVTKASERLTEVKEVAEGESIELKKKRLNEEEANDLPNRKLGFPDFSQMPTPAIVVLTYNRADYLKRTLESIAAVPGFGGYKLYVSQDGEDSGVAELVSKLRSDKLPGLVHLVHKRPSLSRLVAKTEYVARHYRFALTSVFETMNHSHAIVVEDDMLFSSDFLEMFAVTSRLLNEDPTLWCVSSWNDNGLNFLHLRSDRFYRTTRFPGLGWMITQKVWMELSSKWPADAWDYYMQTDVIRKGRDCIAPELSRNHNIGEKGTTVDRTFYNSYIKKNSWNEGPPVNFGDLQYLSKPQFVQWRRGLVEQASVVGRWPEQQHSFLLHWNAKDEGVWLFAINIRDFQKFAKKLKIMDSWRTGHAGLIVLRRAENSIFLLADERECEYLPDNLRKLPAASFTMTTGDLGESCTSTCKARDQRCDESHFQYVNKCSALLDHFPCEEGCQGGVFGYDLPNYQDNKEKMEFYHRCLTTEFIPTCSAQHFSGRRLCPCV